MKLHHVSDQSIYASTQENSKGNTKRDQMINEQRKKLEERTHFTTQFDYKQNPKTPSSSKYSKRRGKSKLSIRIRRKKWKKRSKN